MYLTVCHHHPIGAVSVNAHSTAFVILVYCHCFRAEQILAVVRNAAMEDGSMEGLTTSDTIGPAICACWVGPSMRRFATGHVTGQAFLWELSEGAQDIPGVSPCITHGCWFSHKLTCE